MELIGDKTLSVIGFGDIGSTCGKVAKNGFVFYRIDTTKGQSGSPLLWKNQDKIYAVGIHKGHGKDKNLNIGILFDE